MASSLDIDIGSDWMKKSVKMKKINIFWGIILQLYFIFPWMGEKNNKKNFFLYLIEFFRKHKAEETYIATFVKKDISEQNLNAIANIFLICILVYVIMEIVEIFRLIINIRGKEIKFLSLIELVMSSGILVVLTSLGLDSSWSEKGVSVFPLYILLYLLGMPIWICIRLLIHKAVEEWEESSEQIIENEKKEKYYKQERKRRLYFPGKYSNLFYHILWQNFKYHWRDFAFLFFAVVFSTMFLFVGFAMRSILADSYGYDNELLGLGLTEIMKDCLIIIVLLALFLITLVLVFYRRKRMVDDGIFRTLGMRSNAIFYSQMGEFLAGFVIALAVAFVLGRIFTLILYGGISKHFPQIKIESKVPGNIYFITVLGMIVICLFAFGFSNDIYTSEKSVDARNAAVKSEKIPRMHKKMGALISGCAGIFMLYLYSQRRFAENIILLCIFLMCLYIFIYNVGAILLQRKEKSPDIYLSSLPNDHIIRYKYQTTIKYLSLMVIIHICVLFFFGMKLVSNQIATNTDELYPYDYVWMANSQDEKKIHQIQEKCHATVYAFPMVRVTTIDNTERLEGPYTLVWQQGQNIGIAESTYRELKKMAGEKSVKNLNLDNKGKKIYVVYQQDQGTKAKPIDWYQLMIRPNLHIGQPLFAYDTMEHQKYYPVRMIVGSETSSLIGAWKQGKYENLVVFSDEYFNKIKDSWKTTDMNTGEYVSEKNAKLENNIHEWPTKLVLIKVPLKYQEKADQLTLKFAKKHVYDESFDSLVKSTYSKKEAMKKRQMERIMEGVMNGFVLIILSMISMLLLHIKVQMELPDMKKRYQFMNRLGMNRKERIQSEKKEISRFVIVPLVIAMNGSVVYLEIVFKLRNYNFADIKNYLINSGCLWGLYCFVQVINLKYLENLVVRKIEKGDEK